MEKLLLALCLLFVSCGNNKKTESTTQETSQPVTETKAAKEPKTLIAGDELTFPSKNGGEVKFLFKEINTIKLSDGTYNLVLKVYSLFLIFEHNLYSILGNQFHV